MKKKQYLDHLSKVDIFQALTKKELGLLGKLAETIDIDKGYPLVREGTTGREFFVIAEGKAAVKRGTRKVATLGPGDFFGELALLDGHPRNASVVAETPMTVVVLGQREFLGALHDAPTLAMKLLKGMARRLREADSQTPN